MDFLSQPDFRIAIGSDHAGFALKQAVLAFLKEKGIPVEDYGTYSEERVDYPDFGARVAKAVAAGEFPAGILICGTGIGMSITANKVPGIRAALCTSTYMSEMSRRHNNANILCMGGRVLSTEEALPIVDTWLRTPFEGGRHQKRLEKIQQLTQQVRQSNDD